MVSSFSISLSGLRAASTRLQVSANNLANRNSTSTKTDGVVTNEPYHAQRVDQVSNALGGVNTVVRDVDPPTVTIFNPTAVNADENGASEVPNVDDETELVNQVVASYDFKANLKAIETQNTLFKSLLDIKS